MANLTFDNAYISNYYTIVGPLENQGPLRYYFQQGIDDVYYGEKTWEKAEIKMLKKATESIIKDDINCIISGDLSNQNGTTSYALKDLNKPLISIYAACATGILAIIMGAQMAEKNNLKVLSCTSSHNSMSEKQFRNPTEYGGDKPNYSTYTVTGAASFFIENEGQIKITKGIIGRIIDSGITDANNLGSAMAPAAFEVLKDHLEDKKVDLDEYDLILTGDLSKYGKKVFLELCEKEGIILNNYEDAGLMIYDIARQNVFAGGSGPACVSVVLGSYVLEKIKRKVFKKVLVIGTGALINTVMNNQKETIPVIAHAIVLEAIK